MSRSERNPKAYVRVEPRSKSFRKQATRSERYSIKQQLRKGEEDPSYSSYRGGFWDFTEYFVAIDTMERKFHDC